MAEHHSSKDKLNYDECSASLDREKEAFDRMLPDLLLSKPGKFVAVYGGKIIDEDADEFELARRIEAAYRDAYVLIQAVEPPGNDRVLLESAEMERS